MNCKLISLLITVALCVPFTANAATIEAGVVTADIEAFAADGVPIEINLSDAAIRKAERAAAKAERGTKGGKKAADTGEAMVMAMASGGAGITHFEVYSTFSSNVGWEYFSANQYSSNQNHGGNTFVVTVLQFGQGMTYQGTLSGQSRSATSYPLCGTMSTLHHCYGGEVTTGWLHTYDFSYSGIQGGSFSAAAYSTSAPYGYNADNLYIN